jgi:hypothetical protein
MPYTYKQNISSESTFADSKFGFSIAMAERTMVVGAPYDGTATPPGMIYIYEKGEDEEWYFIKSLIPGGGPVSNVRFGYSVSIHGDIIVVGAIDRGKNGIKSGSVHLVVKDSNGEWDHITLGQNGRRVSSDQVAGDELGTSVEISEGYVITGAPKKNSNTGSAYIFKASGTGWDFSSEIILLRYADGETVVTGEANDSFGSSVCIHGDYAFVGAPGEKNNQGAVYVYYKDAGSADSWGFVERIESSNIAEGDKFGTSLCMEDDYCIVGASEKTSINAEQYSGAAYIFKLVSGEWNQISELRPRNNAFGNKLEYFGYSVDIDKDRAVVGSYGSYNGSDTGAIDIYSKIRNWGHIEQLQHPDIVINDNFGYSVAIDGINVVGGAPETDVGAFNNIGSCYIYEWPLTSLRQAQEFWVYGYYVPSKASIYLKRAGKNIANYWTLSSTTEVIIDASNFSTIDQAEEKIILDDVIDNYSGNGYMVVSPSTAGFGQDPSHYRSMPHQAGEIKYPIVSTTAEEYYVWIRYSSDFIEDISAYGLSCSCDVLIDGEVIGSVEGEVVSGSWRWDYVKLVIPDSQPHILSLRPTSQGTAIDKISIAANMHTPVGRGHTNSTSPYLTLHLKMYKGEGTAGFIEQIYVYDYKNSIDDVIQDDWYNFDISLLDTSIGQYITPRDFNDNFFIVLSTSGYNSKNFVLWELVPSDPYGSERSYLRL